MATDQHPAARAALAAAGFQGTTAAEDRLAEVLHRQGHDTRWGNARLDTAVEALADLHPRLFGYADDEETVAAERDRYGNLIAGRNDSHAAFRALSRAGFTGTTAAARALAPFLGQHHDNPVLLAGAARQLAADFPELFDPPNDLDDGQGDGEPTGIDRRALYDEWVDSAGETYEGELHSDGHGVAQSPALVGRHGPTARTSARALAQAGYRPTPPPERLGAGERPHEATSAVSWDLVNPRRPEREPLPEDPSERMTERMLRQAGYH
jgi:hypothetical protein